jgi:hypothetical protein
MYAVGFFSTHFMSKVSQNTRAIPKIHVFVVSHLACNYMNLLSENYRIFPFPFQMSTPSSVSMSQSFIKQLKDTQRKTMGDVAQCQVSLFEGNTQEANNS